MREGRFREDLFYRLNVIAIELPPLRSRREDIPLLATHFLKFYADENGSRRRALTPEAMRILMDYDWPGNVRELENVMERGVVLSSGGTIGVDLLPGHITGSSYSSSLLEHRPDASLFDIMEEIERRIIVDKLERCNWQPDRGRGAIPDPAVDAEPEDQAAEHRDSEAEPGLKAELRAQLPHLPASPTLVS